MASRNESMDWEQTHQGYIALIRAIESNDKTEVETLILQGALSETLQFCHETPLQVAIKKNNIDIVDILISNGADFNQETEHGKPFHCAASLGFTNLLKYFLDKGLDVNTKNRCGDTALHEICKKKNLEDATTCAFLLDHGADVNAENFQNRDPLYYFSRQLKHVIHTVLETWYTNLETKQLISAFEFFNVFLNHRVNLDDTLLNSRTLLIGAVVTENEILVEYLCKRYLEIDSSFSFEQFIRGGATPVHWAVRVKNLNIIRILVDNGARIVSSDFHLAVIKEFPDIVNFFLERGVDVNEKSKDGNSALHLICKAGSSETSEAVCKILLKHGAFLEASNFEKKTPLHLAISNKNMPIISNLMENEAYIHNKTIYGKAFHVVFDHSFGDFDPNIANYFLERGVDVDVANMFGQTALHFICKDARHWNSKAFEFLSNHGANVNAVDQEQKTPLFYVLNRLCNKSPLSSVSIRNRTSPLYYCPYSLYLSIIQELLSHGANLDVFNECPIVLREAAIAGNVELAELLLKMNVDIDAGGNEGITSLHCAAFCGHYEMICTLLCHGASIDAVMSGNLTALHIAVSQKHLKCALALMNFGADIKARNSWGRSPLSISTLNEEESISIALLLRGVNINTRDVPSDTNFNADKGRFINPRFFDLHYKYYASNYVVKRDFFRNNDPETSLDPVNLCLRFKEERERILYLNEEELTSIVETGTNLVDLELAKEVMLLRTTDICGGLTMYELLTKSVWDIAAFLLHEDLPIPELTMFKYYGYYFPLQQQIIDVERHNLRKKAGYGLSVCLMVRIPEEIIDKIIDFLNKRDMLNILRAVGYEREHINGYEKKIEELEREFRSIFERR